MVGPQPELEVCRPWLGPEYPVTLREIRPGDSLELDGYLVRGLGADHEAPTVLYDVTGPEGNRLLYATDTGPLPDATVAAARGAAFDVVLMEQTFGDAVDHGTLHLDLETFPAQLRRLRSVGAVTDVVAVHLGHHNPPGPVLAQRLAAHGARIVDDGTTVTSRGEQATLPRGAYRREPWNSDASAAPA